MRRHPKRDLQSQRQSQRQRYGNSLVLAPRASPGPSYRSGAVGVEPYQDIGLGQQQQTESGSELGFEPGSGDGVGLDLFDDQQLMLLNHFDLDFSMNMNMNMGLNMGYSWMEIVPLTEDQMIRRVNTSQDITWSIERRQALESALSVAGRVLGSMEQSQGTETGVGVERHIPSLELLYWMLNGMIPPV